MQKTGKNVKMRITGVCLGGAAVIAAVVLLLRSPAGQEDSDLLVPAVGTSEMQESGERAAEPEPEPESVAESKQEAEPESVAESEQEAESESAAESESDPAQEAEMLTLEGLKELLAEPEPLLEHYTGYQGFVDLEYSDSYYRCLLQTTENGCDYWVDINVRTEDNRIDRMALTRRNDALGVSLYRMDNGYRRGAIEEIDVLEDTGELFRWVRMYSFPDGHMAGINYEYEYHNIYCCMRPDEFRTDLGDGTWKGMTYKWIFENSEYDPGSTRCGTPEWGYVACFMQVPTECLVFEDGILVDAQLGYDHAELLTEWENVVGCREQALLCKMKVEQYSPAEIEEAAEAGNPIPEEHQTANMWYVCIGREHSPYAYVFAMKEKYCSWEEAAMFSWWIEFRDEAWQ